MNIAIYAIDDAHQEQILTHAERFLRQRGLNGCISRFDSAETLWHAMETVRFELVFLVLSGQEDVFAAAVGVRQRSVQCEIIFVAETSAHVVGAMDHRAIGYLRLPLNGGEFDGAMERFLRSRSGGMRLYAVHTRLSDRLIPHDRIRYFHSEGHYVSVYVEGGGEPVAHLRRLDDIQRELTALPYVRCHQSYLVHCRVIRGVSGRYLLLDGGEKIPVSRKYAGQVARSIPGGET